MYTWHNKLPKCKVHNAMFTSTKHLNWNTLYSTTFIHTGTKSTFKFTHGEVVFATTLALCFYKTMKRGGGILP